MKRRIMVLRLLVIAVVIATMGLPVVSQADSTTTVYADDRPGWESAVVCYEEEFFADATLNPGVSVVTGNGYVDATKEVWWDSLVCPAGATTTIWEFDFPIYAFGGNWDPGVPGGPGARIAVAINGSWDDVGEIPETYTGQFWGFVSTVPFSKVRLQAGSKCDGAVAETYELDNMVYSDITPPVLTVPADVTVEQASAAGTDVPLTASATDNCDPDVTITSDELPIYPLGTTTVTFTATDDSGNSSSASMTVTVVDTTAPELWCVEAVNPHGNTIPGEKRSDNAESKGRNPDGFYQLFAEDICDAEPEIYVGIDGDPQLFGPFASGVVIKFTEDPGAVPSIEKMGSSEGQAGAVTWDITVPADPVITAVDLSGNTSTCTDCLVPPPPK